MKKVSQIGVISADRSEPGGFPRNIGDAALTDAIAQALQKRGYRVGIADFGVPANGSNRSETRLQIDGVRGLVSFIKANDMVCFGGGTLLQDDQLRAFKGLPRLAFLVSAMSFVCRKPLIIWFVGAERVERFSARLLLTACIHLAKVVYVRESASQRVVKEIFKKHARVGADAIWLFDTSPPPSDRDRKGLLVALNRNEVSNLSNSQLRGWAERYRDVRLVSMDQSESWDFKDIDCDALPAGVTIEPPRSDWPEVLEMIQSSEALIASRMHALYFAALTQTPLLAVRSSAKVEQFAKEFKAPQFSLRSEDQEEPQLADDIAVSDARQRALRCVDQAMKVARATN